MKKTWVGIIGIVLVAGLLAVAGVVSAHSPAHKVSQGTIKVQTHAEVDFPALATVTLEQAVQKAREKVSGGILKAELEEEDGFLVWEVEVVTPEKTVMEVTVDAGSGQVLEVAAERGDDEEFEEAEEHHEGHEEHDED